MKTKIIIGSRGSKLALVQTESVAARIREMRPHLEVSISIITTSGDRDQHTRLDRIGIAVFVKELEEALLSGKIDFAVHSLKDMPVEIPAGLRLLATPERQDTRDVLVAKAKLDKLAPGSRIGTDSLRRTVQLNQYRPDLNVCGIRGNVDTRVRKASSCEVDGVIVAAAGVIRLGLKDKITEYLPLEHFLPSVGQGALAIEARSNDKETAELIYPLNHPPTWQCTMAERAFLHTLGGGCRAPIAALGRISNTTLKLEGMIASIRSKEMLQSSEEGNAASPEEIGTRLAQKMLTRGASQFIAEVRGK
jgi:hydroxymethylbilane synthase